MLDFWGRLLGLGPAGQLGQVGLLQSRTAEVVEQQALGHGDQKGTGLARNVELLATEQAHEGVLAQVFGTLAAGCAALQPGQQPGAMVAVQRTDQLGMWAVRRRQEASPKRMR